MDCWKQLLVFSFVILLVFSAGCSSPTKNKKGSCGDGVCDGIEKSTGNCPKDCAVEPSGGLQRTSSQEALKTTIEPPGKEVALTSGGFVLGFMEVSANKEAGDELAYAVELEAHGARKPFWFMNGRFDEVGSSTTAELLENGFEIIASVQPMPAAPPDDYGAFKTKLKQLVESNKHAIKYWQLGNEPDLAWAKRGYNADDYVSYFIESAQVVREECPDCRIVLAGISNQYDSGDNYDFYKKVLEGIRKKSGDSRPFDVFDVHIYTDDGDYGKVGRAVRDYRQLLRETGYGYDIEFVSTEFGTYSGQPKMQGQSVPFQSEDFQARMLVKLYASMFSAGVTKAYWVDVVNNYKFGFQGAEGGFFDLTGLVYTGKGSYDKANNIGRGAKKQAFYAYKTMASKINGKYTAEKIADGIYKFSKDEDVVYVAWSDEVGGKLPAELFGRFKITDYPGGEQTMDADSVSLNESPILLERI